jgi:hypothetical protein
LISIICSYWWTIFQKLVDVQRASRKWLTHIAAYHGLKSSGMSSAARVEPMKIMALKNQWQFKEAGQRAG